MSPARIARADAEVHREALSIRLRTLREAAGLTQAQMAKRAALTQSQLSRLEQSPNLELRSIFRYAQAAGADRVEISVVLGAKQIPLAIMETSSNTAKGVLRERRGPASKRAKPIKARPPRRKAPKAAAG
jgi:transcriptional regulator with XRE-family HTH domain